MALRGAGSDASENVGRRVGMQGSVRTRRTGDGGLPAAAPGSPGAPRGSASAVLGGGSVLRAADVDVGQGRERRRQRRLARLAIVLWVATLAVWWRVLTGGALHPPGGPRPRAHPHLWLPAGAVVRPPPPGLLPPPPRPG